MQRTRLIIAALALAATATACNTSDGDTVDSVTDSAVTADTDAPVDSAPATDPDNTDTDPTGTADSNDPTDSTDPGSDQEGTTVPDTPNTPSTPSGPPSPVEPLYDAGDIDAGLQPFIGQATDDLAARLDIDASTITTHAAVLVVWPDSSLGCPQPDMQYAQVLTDGSVIELEHDGDIYRFHTGGANAPFICEQAATKAPATPERELLTLDDFD